MASKLYSRHGGTADADFDDLTPIAPYFDDAEPLIQLGMECQNGGAGQGKFVVVDPITNTDLAIWLPARTMIRWTEDAPGCEYWLAVGRVSGKDVGRGDVAAGDFVEHEVTVDDANVDLRGLAFTEAWVRPEETDTDRIYALQAYILNASDSFSPSFRPSTMIVAADSHLAPDSDTVTMPAKTYPIGTNPYEVIDDCASSAGKIYGVCIHHGGFEIPQLMASWTYSRTPFVNPTFYSDDQGHGWLTTGTGDGTPGEAGWPAYAHVYSGYDSPTASHIPFAEGDQIQVEMDVAWRYNQSVDYCALNFFDASDVFLEKWKFAEGPDYPAGGAIYHVSSGYHTAPTDTSYFTFEVQQSPGISVEWDNVYLNKLVVNDDCSHLCLRYHLETDHTIDPSPVKISDKVANWDPENPTDPVYEPIWDQGKGLAMSGQASISGLVSQYGLGTGAYAVFVHDTSQEDDYEYWIDSYHDSDSVNSTQAAARAQAILDYRKYGDFTFRVSVAVMPEQIALLGAGRSLQIDTAVILGGQYRGEYKWERIVALSWEPRADGMYWAHMQLTRGLRNQPPSRGKTQPAASTPQSALDLPYDGGTSSGGSGSGLVGGTLGTVQDAIDELAETAGGGTLEDFQGQHRYLIAAHRGDINPVDGYPENTLESMRQAALRGADQVECDVQQSSDGIWHLLHDTGATALNRTTNLTGDITSTTAAAILAGHIDGGYGYDAGRHGTSLDVPLLIDVLEAITPYDCVIYLDCKTDGTAGDLAQFVEDNFYPQRVVIQAHSLTDAADVKAVNDSFVVATQTFISDSPETEPDVDLWLAQNTEVSTLADITVHAPDQVYAYLDVTTLYGVDETTYLTDLWDIGVRCILTNDLPNAVLIRHGYEFAGGGFGTPAIVLGTAAAAGAATTTIRSDSTIVAFDATVPVTQAFSDAAATGSAAVAARRDHVHGMPANPGGHTHVATEQHLSDGSTTTYTLDNYYEPESVVAWNTTTLARLTVTEVLPDQATVSAAGSSGDKIVFDYAATLA